MSRVQRRFLPASAWTALVPLAGSEGERHFTVIDVPHSALLVMRAVLTNRTYEVPIADLDDATRWASGWLALPSNDAPA